MTYGVVYKNQVIKIDKIYGNEFDFSITGEGEVAGYFSFIQLMTGYQSELFMTQNEARQHATKYSQTYKSSNKYVKDKSMWNTDFDKMALKTVQKLHLNGGDIPLSSEIKLAIVADQGVKTDNGYNYPDNTIEIGEIKEDNLAKIVELFEKHKGEIDPETSKAIAEIIKTKDELSYRKALETLEKYGKKNG